ncbi:MAG TPA: tetratricopeptide repeat protein, partial [Nitrospiraceae bacterium]|nr:tetratricopeptide repeat protein [Nitrospiraceae bacterium]
ASKGQFDAAIAEWKKLTIDSPTDGTIFNSIGDLHLKRNANAEAITAFLQAAAAFRAEGSTLKAIAAYKKILKVDPGRHEVYRHLGDLNAERGLLSSAVQDYLTLGKFYLKEGKSKEALDIYRRIITQDPSNLDAQQQVAELCVQENLQDEAIRVYLQLGRERSAQQRLDEARDAYLAVARLDPNNAEAKEILAVLQNGTGSPASAAATSKSTPAAAKPVEPGDLLGEATRRMEEGQYAGAEAILTQLLSREPGNPQICQLLARLHLLQGNLNVALGEYRFLAGAALRAQDYPLADSLIQEYLAVEPNSVPMLELSGELNEERGDAAAAAQQYGRAAEILLEHPEPGMPSLPAELYEKVRTLAPGSALAKKLAAAFDPSGSAAVQESVASDSMIAAASDAADTSPPLADAAPAETFRVMAEESVPAEFTVAAGCTPAQTQTEPIALAGPVSSASSGGEPAADSTAPPLDAETRYALALAYKDMGLLEEAKEEFLSSMKNAGLFVDSCLMMALCFKEQEQFDRAIQILEKLLNDSRCAGKSAETVRYELGRLYEKTSARDRAIAIYQSIPSLHDVPQRLQALRTDGHNGTATVAHQTAHRPRAMQDSGPY